MAGDEQLVDTIAGFALFADLDGPALERVVHTVEEAMFPAGSKVIREGIRGSGLHLILEGEATVIVDGTERAKFGPGDFFGEISVLLGVLPVGDVVATKDLRALVLPGADAESFLVGNPRIAYRMLQAMARRLRASNRWTG